MTFDWTADAANGWTIPIGADVGKAFSMGSQAMGLQVGAYDLVNARWCPAVDNPRPVNGAVPTRKVGRNSSLY